MALVPSVLRSGETASFSFTLFDGDEPGSGQVTVTVLDKGKTIAEGTADIDGTGTVDFELPAVAPGEYEVQVTGGGLLRVHRGADPSGDAALPRDRQAHLQAGADHPDPPGGPRLAS